MRAFARRRCQPELIKIVDSRILPNAVELFHKRGGKNFAQRTAHHLPARLGIHHFHLRVPGLDAVLQIDRHHAHVDRFDDVLVEIFQPFVLADFLFERGVEPRRSGSRCRYIPPAFPAVRHLRWTGSRLPSSCPARETRWSSAARGRGCSNSDRDARWLLAPRKFRAATGACSRRKCVRRRLRCRGFARKPRDPVRRPCANPKRFRKFKARRVVVAEKDGDAIDQQRACQPVDQR